MTEVSNGTVVEKLELTSNTGDAGQGLGRGGSVRWGGQEGHSVCRDAGVVRAESWGGNNSASKEQRDNPLQCPRRQSGGS